MTRGDQWIDGTHRALRRIDLILSESTKVLIIHHKGHRKKNSDLEDVSWIAELFRQLALTTLYQDIEESSTSRHQYRKAGLPIKFQKKLLSLKESLRERVRMSIRRPSWKPVDQTSLGGERSAREIDARFG